MKSLYSPLSVLFGSSHEQLNTWHRISGRVIWTLLLCHASWYLNAFIQIGNLSEKLTTPIIIFGVVSFQLINLLIITSSKAVRRWSYRVFFITHLFVAIAIIPLLFFHAAPIRIYIIEAIALFLIDIGIRKYTTFTAFATVRSVPKTSLLEITIPVTVSQISQFQYAPGQHVYLSIPPSSVPTSAKYNRHLHEFLYNPFTIASVTDTPTPQITLTLRTLNGPTTSALSSLSHLSKARPPLNIEGPYGSTRKFPNLAEKFDRILLVAGGVGATFILPIYRAAKEAMENEGRPNSTVRMIWVMRDAAESSWALSPPTNPTSPQDTDEEPKFEYSNDVDIELYITSPQTSHSITTSTTTSTHEPNTIEMHTLSDPPSSSSLPTPKKYSRPDLRAIVDETFTQGLEERVAVLVCGPPGMAEELRLYVGDWVTRGRYVWWHDEGFGW
ncbi:b0d8148f-6895-4957-8a6e-9fe150bc80fc [Sclerotinia trifoliorum]|uniref:ferric-chelate reductase (NADPH) n=1 Tax=Sclerotinia trifoliorum TaxID=28548 RepID=A0A8H2ZTS1_9HELO|nr:b0d8148f-6895-4957-8a6e-9fe150bc80fc [Sclerotinia trifoliorum]